MGIHTLSGAGRLCKGARSGRWDSRCEADAAEPLPVLLEELGPLPGAVPKASDEPT